MNRKNKRILRLKVDDGMTVGIALAVRNIALALAIAVTLLNLVEHSIRRIHFLTEVHVLLGAMVVCRCRRGSLIFISSSGAEDGATDKRHQEFSLHRPNHDS